MAIMNGLLLNQKQDITGDELHDLLDVAAIDCGDNWGQASGARGLANMTNREPVMKVPEDN